MASSAIVDEQPPQNVNENLIMHPIKQSKEQSRLNRESLQIPGMAAFYNTVGHKIASRPRTSGAIRQSEAKGNNTIQLKQSNSNAQQRKKHMKGD